jgi:hypothetical protein
VLSTLTPQLEGTGLKLIEPGDPTLLYQRRYLPTGALLLALLLLAISAFPLVSAVGNDHRLIWLTLAAVVVAAMFLRASRRSEMLTVTVMTRAGGSVAMVAGYANELAHISIQHWQPPGSPQLRGLPAPHAVETAAAGLADHRPSYEGA